MLIKSNMIKEGLAITSKSCELIKKQCSYVTINTRAFEPAANLEPIKTSAIFVPPQLVGIRVNQINKPREMGLSDRSQAAPSIDTETLIRRIFAELETQEAPQYSLQANSPAVRIQDDTSNVRSSTRNVLIVAPAGSGKSILLDRLALWLAEKAMGQRPDESNISFETWLHLYLGVDQDFAGKIPLLLRCKELSSGASSIADLKRQIIAAIFQSPVEDVEEWIAAFKALDASEFVILVDGLDELPKETTPMRVYDALLGLFGLDETDSADKFSIFASTRDTAVDDDVREFLKINTFETFTTVALNRMIRKSRRNFIYQFARSWYICQLFSEDEASRKAKILESAIEHDWAIRFRNFIRTPLELTLCLTLFSNVENFPTTEHGLYLKFANARLRWRRGSANPDDLLLLLSYCASRTAYQANESGLFDLEIDEGMFLNWLEMAYSILGSRLENIFQRGFGTSRDAASHDLNELVEVHGMLSRSNGKVSFEHRQLQVFFAENGLLRSACPKGFLRQTYAEMYSSKKTAGILEQDWATLFMFFVQDSRIGDKPLKDLWRAVIKNADPKSYSAEESDIFLAILMDGRIANSTQIEQLKALLQIFCSRSIHSGQIDGYRKISTDRRYSNVVRSIENLYQESNQYEYCFVVAAFDIFSIVRKAEGEEVSSYDAEAILPWQEPLDTQMLIRLLHRIEILYFFRQLNLRQLAFSKFFFSGGSEECNNAVRVVLKQSLERFCTTNSQKNSEEIIRILPPLSEDTVCRQMLYDAISSGSPSTHSFFAAIEQQVQTWIADATHEKEGSIPLAIKRMMWLLASLSANEDFDIAFDNYPCKNLRLIAKRHYVESMWWLSDQIFNFSESAESNESLILDDFGAMGFSDSMLDGGLEAFMRPLWKNNIIPNRRIVLSEDILQEVVLAAVRNVLRERTDDVLLDVDDFRIAAASVINAARFNVLIDPNALMLISRIFGLVKTYSKSIDESEYGSPGETLRIICNTKQLHTQIRGDVRKALEESAAKPQQIDELKFIAFDEEGNRLECETLFTFDSPKTGKSYIVYTDNTVDEDGNTKVYASIYDPLQLRIDSSGELASLELSPIESEKEWALIESILDDLQSNE